LNKPQQIVVATHNQHKAGELQAMLGGMGISIHDLHEFSGCPEVKEDGETLEANALKKAQMANSYTGLPALADDTGLEVYFLLGKPGVHSARFAGESATYADNNQKLLDELVQVPERKRGARFRCVIAYVDGQEQLVFEGSIDGKIGMSLRGTNGFGYDPLFLPNGYGLSYAELSTDEKNALSHRFRALSKFLNFLSTL